MPGLTRHPAPIGVAVMPGLTRHQALMGVGGLRVEPAMTERPLKRVAVMPG